MDESEDDLPSDDGPANEDAELLARLTAGLFSSLVSSSQQQQERPLSGSGRRWQQQQQHQPANLLDAAVPQEQGNDGAAAGDAGIQPSPAGASTALWALAVTDATHVGLQGCLALLHCCSLAVCAPLSVVWASLSMMAFLCFQAMQQQ